MNPTYKHLIPMLLLALAAPAFCDPGDDLVISGLSKQNEGDFAGAIADYTKALALKPDAKVYNLRGQAKKASGDAAGAIADYSLAITVKPDDPEGYFNRGTARAAKGDDLDGALADFTKALALKPDDSASYTNRGLTRQIKGDLDGAIADFTTAIDLKPDVPTYLNRAVAKTTKGDTAGALADYDKAIELSPNNPWAYRGRAYLHYDTRDFPSALVDFQKLVRLQPTADEPQFRFWLIRARLGDPDTATTDLKNYLAVRTAGKPDDWPSKIGNYLVGRLAEADLLAAAKNPDPKIEATQLCQAYFYAASKHLIAKDTPAAIDLFQKAVNTNATSSPDYPTAAAEIKKLQPPK